MHQPHAQPRASIYYRYEVFPAAPRPDVETHVPVVVVGAGPIGLHAALDLARHGVPVLLLAAERQVSEGSRAIVYTRRSMEILHTVGVAEAIERRGLSWRHGNSFVRGQCVFRMEAPHDDDERFMPMTNLQQQFLEQTLVEAAARQPLVSIRWGHKVIGVSQTARGAVLEVDTADGPYRQPCDWVVAADGARSTLRQQLDLRMEGAAYEGRFVIADIRIDLPYPTERRAYFEPDWNPGNTVLMHREPEGIWRIDYQLPTGETPEQALAPESLKARIDAQLAMIGHAGLPWQMDWCSVYSARAMTLPDYVSGRVIFTGDAAHLLPIFGVRGANTGFQDAQNLAWKLAAVVKGQAGPGLLASYSHERVGAAREIIDEAGKSTRFMTPPTRGYRLLRDATLSLSLSQDFVRPLFHWRTSRAHVYARSPLNCLDDDDGRFTAGPAVGAPMLDARLSPGGHLMDGFAPASHLLVFGAGAVAAARDAAARTALPVKVWAVTADGRAAGADRGVADPEGRLARRHGVPSDGAVYLIRPDQHVAARWLQADSPRISAALRRSHGH
ncbi:FAD-dependent monooxygenase [Ideonella sp. A 288]|uniref:FAD-dependent monooxygenase n=1 Tax=Ideonella sp. A 288 TaxID=1962181 RepID=UPI000B4AF353|nr:FAD-dependent monooxygenase [Ideonella sp. A 288]